ncbi:protein E6-like [Salvia splendens]|uniref:protein E6-like n=1 Tax=Salvia splendens TaxID=180675 RepID=UPI001C27C602|nr:protein E6-like [Salvia splendens]
MASPAMKLSIFLLLSLFSSLHTHARESQFFNKIPSTTATTTNTEVPTNQQDPTFLPDNDNSYGLYGHESGQNPPSTTEEFKQPPNKYLPKNYNPVAYVTQPESDLNDSPASFTEERTFSTNPNNNYYNGEQNSYNNFYNGEQNSFYNQQQQQQEQTEFKSYRNPASNYNGGSSFNRQPQGMSDTRVVEHGKYYYDTNSERFSRSHPYETLRGARQQNEFNNRNFYGSNAYEFNGDNQDQFQDDDNMP